MCYISGCIPPLLCRNCKRTGKNEKTSGYATEQMSPIESIMFDPEMTLKLSKISGAQTEGRDDFSPEI